MLLKAQPGREGKDVHMDESHGALSPPERELGGKGAKLPSQCPTVDPEPTSQVPPLVADSKRQYPSNIMEKSMACLGL